jgi:hypothetical protein
MWWPGGVRLLPTQVLNVSQTHMTPAEDAVSVAERVRESITRLYELSLSRDGACVDYRQLLTCPKFAAFARVTEELQVWCWVPLSSLCCVVVVSMVAR